MSRSRPQAACTVDKYPCPGAADSVANFTDRIESTGVDISGLGAHDSWSGNCRNRFRAHAPLTVDGYPDYPVTSQAQHAEGFEQGRVSFFTHDDRYWRGTR